MTAAVVDTLNLSEQTTIQLSQQKLTNLLHEAEAAFMISDIFQVISTDLQKRLGASSEGIQNQMQTLGQEAMRLLLGQVIQSAAQLGGSTHQASDPSQSHTMLPSTSSATPPDSAHTAVSTTDTEFTPDTDRVSQSDLNTTSVHTIQADGEWQAWAEESQETILIKIGQLLQRRRQDQNLSLDELHTLTYVPKHHLQAIETGQIEKLPELIYIQGFIRRMGNTLGLAGNDLAQTLATKTPSRNTPIITTSQAGAVYRDGPPIGLYLGYAALIAGSTGSLVWTTQKLEAQQIPITTSPIATPESDQRLSTQTEAQPQEATRGISAPETLPPEKNPTILPFSTSLEVNDR